ncbi:MAG: Spy/CpxP family protein refolding chaperone [Pseudomonadales bacterium]|nr:Spy/CpxP family protein refolding chaperone [Pseudomonadales bacterium]
MNNNIITFIAAPAMLLLSTLSTANSEEQNQQGFSGEQQSEFGRRDNQRGPDMEQKLQMLTKKLSLTTDQQTQIKALFEKQQETRKASGEQRQALHQAIRNLDVNAADYAEKLAAVKQQAGLSAGNKIQQMMSTRQAMQEILTPEQQELMKQMKGEKRGKRDRQGADPADATS